MKTLEFIFQDTQIHFALQNDGEVMVYATEMAKVFNKKTKLFLKSAHAKAFIAVAERAPNGARSDHKLVENRGHMGIYFERRLALKFAAWLDPEFEVWVYSTIDNLLFSNYKKPGRHMRSRRLLKLLWKILKPDCLKKPIPSLLQIILIKNEFTDLLKLKKPQLYAIN